MFDVPRSLKHHVISVRPFTPHHCHGIMKWKELVLSGSFDMNKSNEQKKIEFSDRLKTKVSLSMCKNFVQLKNTDRFKRKRGDIILCECRVREKSIEKSETH